MAKEVSGFHLQISLDIGEFFGVPRGELLSFFPSDANLNSKFTRVDWEPFAAMTDHVCSHIGEREELIPAGQRYTYERIGTRFTHLMTQFGNSWDRVLWASKHFFSPRLIKGYETEYEKLGHNHFRLSSSIPDHYAGCEAYFWLFAGIWTGGNKISNLKHDILSLEVHPHGSNGEIRFAERNRKSLWAFNPLSSRVKAIREIKQSRREVIRQLDLLETETRNLNQAFGAVSDGVFLLDGSRILESNHEARRLAEHPEFHSRYLSGDPASAPFQVGENWYRLRERVPLHTEAGPGWLVTLEDVSRTVSLERERKQSPLRAREQAGQQLEQHLGCALSELADELQTLQEQEEDASIRETLGGMRELADLCRRQGFDLVMEQLRGFSDSGELMCALFRLAEEVSELSGFKVNIEGHEVPPLASDRDRGVLFLILQEAVRNAYRHSGGTEVTLSVAPDCIRVLDNGSGLVECHENAAGQGCRNIRDRSASLGWTATPAGKGQNGWILTPRPTNGKVRHG